MRTIAAAGMPTRRRGCAHVYLANRSMTRRACVDADGELLIVAAAGAQSSSSPNWAS